MHHKTMNRNLMPIGRFSKSCRLSIKALRHYDDVGLLKPAYVDSQSGYRYYSTEQAREAIMIGLLRSLDIPIPTVKKLLLADNGQFQNILLGEEERIKHELRQKQIILSSLQRLSNQISPFPYAVAIREEPDYTMAVMSCVTNPDSLVQDSTQLIYDLFGELEKAGRQYQDPVMCINDDPDKHDSQVVHACCAISEPYPDLPKAKILEVKGGQALWLRHQGPYQELGLAYHCLFAWMQEKSYEQRDSMREIYLNDPANTAQDNLLTEVILPIKSN